MGVALTVREMPFKTRISGANGYENLTFSNCREVQPLGGPFSLFSSVSWMTGSRSRIQK